MSCRRGGRDAHSGQSGGAGPEPTVAEVLRAAVRSRPGRLPQHHWKTLNALIACRTPRLGGHLYRCEDCGREHFVPYSCRNRHCPCCQKAQAIDWLQHQQADLLPVPYFHIVFTLPHALNALIAQNQRALYNLLFAAASATLLQFGRQRLEAQIGLTAVLHTWSQTLGAHYHLHCIVTGGGVSRDGQQWKAAAAGYLFPVKALSVVFRAKFRDGLEKLYEDGRLAFHGQLEALGEERAFRALMAAALREQWVVYAKRPFAGPGQVLGYLSRYTHRVAIANSRILALDAPNDAVTFAYKDYRRGGCRRTMRLALGEFLRRFCLHILPERFVKIRHYGLLGNHQRKQKLAHARRLLGQRAPEHDERPGTEQASQAPSASPPALVCLHCGSANLLLIESCRPQAVPPIDTS